MPDNNNKPKPGDNGYVDPVTTAILGEGSGAALADQGIAVRPVPISKSFEINKDRLAELGITSADDPRFVKMHSQATSEFVNHADEQLRKPWDYINDDMMLEGQSRGHLVAGPQSFMSLNKYLKDYNVTDAIRNTERANTMVPGDDTPLGHVYDAFGRSFRNRTDEQVAEVKDVYGVQTPEGMAYKPLSEYKLSHSLGYPMRRDEKGNEHVLVMGKDKDGTPLWVEQSAQTHLSKSSLRSMYGPKEMESGWWDTMKDSALNTMTDMYYGALGAAAEFIGGAGVGYGSGMDKEGKMNMYKQLEVNRRILTGVAAPLTAAMNALDWLTNRKGQDLVDWGSMMQNKAGIYTSKLSREADEADLFSAHGMSKLVGSAVPQAIAQFGAGAILGATTRAITAAIGVNATRSRVIGDAVSRAGSHLMGASYAMHGMNDEAKQMGINAQDRISLMGLAGMATLLAEGALMRTGAGGFADGIMNKTDFREQAQRKVTEAAREAMAKAGTELAQATTDEAKNTAKKNIVAAFLGKLYGGITAPLRKVAQTKTGTALHAGLEEAYEEVLEDTMNNFTKYTYDSFFADEGTSKGRGQFGSTLLPDLESLAGSFVGGLFGGMAAGGLGAAVYGVHHDKIVADAWRSDVATKMKQADAEKLISEQFARAWKGDKSKNKDGSANPGQLGDIYTTALEGELAQLRLAYATKERMGLNDAKLIADVMGGDNALASRALSLGISRERAKAEMASAQAAAQADPSNAALATQAAEKKAAYEAIDKQVNELMSGKTLAKAKASMFINAMSIQGRAASDMAKSITDDAKALEEWKKAEAEAKAKGETVPEKPKPTALKTNDERVSDAIKALQAKPDGWVGLDEGFEALAKLDATQQNVAQQVQQELADDAANEATLKEIESLDLGTEDGLRKALIALRKLRNKRLSDTKGKDDAGNAVDSHYWRYNAAANNIENAIADATFIDTTKEQADEDIATKADADAARIAKLTYLKIDDNEYDSMPEAYDDMYLKAKALERTNKAGTEVGVDDIVPGDRGVQARKGYKLAYGFATDMTNEDGTPFIAPGYYITDDEKVQGISLDETSARYLRALMTVDGVDTTQALPERYYDLAMTGQAGKTEMEEAQRWFDVLGQNMRWMNNALHIVNAAAKGYMSAKELELLGLGGTWWQEQLKEATEREKYLKELQENIAKAKNASDKAVAEDMLRLKQQSNRKYPTKLGQVLDAIGRQQQVVALYMSDLERLVDTYDEEQKRITKTDIQGRHYFHTLLLKHIAGGNGDISTKVNGVDTKLSSLAGYSKGANDLTMGDVLALQQWWHHYLNSSGVAIPDALLKEMIKGLNDKRPLSVGKMPIDWRGFTIEHINGSKAADNIDENHIRTRYLVQLLYTTLAADMVGVHQGIGNAITSGVKNGTKDKLFMMAPSREQIIAAEYAIAHNIAANSKDDAYRERIASLFDILFDNEILSSSDGTVVRAQSTIAINGNGGSGKTTMTIPMILQHAKAKGQKVVIIGHKESLNEPLSRHCQNAGIVPQAVYVGVDTFLADKDKWLAMDNVLYIMDEYSLIDTDSLVRKPNNLYAFMSSLVVKRGGQMLLLGDTMQTASAPENIPFKPEVDGGFLATTNISYVHRSGIEGIAKLQSEARIAIMQRKIVGLLAGEWLSSVPLVHHTPNDSSKEWVGVRHYGTTDEMRKDAIERIKAGKGYIVVLSDTQRQAWVDALTAAGIGDADSHVKTISMAVKSPQGSEADEVFIDFINDATFQTQELNYWLTSVSRGKRFVAFTGVGTTQQNQQVEAKDVPSVKPLDADTIAKRHAAIAADYTSVFALTPSGGKKAAAPTGMTKAEEGIATNSIKQMWSAINRTNREAWDMVVTQSDYDAWVQVMNGSIKAGIKDALALRPAFHDKLDAAAKAAIEAAINMSLRFPDYMNTELRRVTLTKIIPKQNPPASGTNPTANAQTPPPPAKTPPATTDPSEAKAKAVIEGAANVIYKQLAKAGMTDAAIWNWLQSQSDNVGYSQPMEAPTGLSAAVEKTINNLLESHHKLHQANDVLYVHLWDTLVSMTEHAATEEQEEQEPIDTATSTPVLEHKDSIVAGGVAINKGQSYTYNGVNYTVLNIVNDGNTDTIILQRLGSVATVNVDAATVPTGAMQEYRSTTFTLGDSNLVADFNGGTVTLTTRNEWMPQDLMGLRPGITAINTNGKLPKASNYRLVKIEYISNAGGRVKAIALVREGVLYGVWRYSINDTAVTGMDASYAALLDKMEEQDGIDVSAIHQDIHFNASSTPMNFASWNSRFLDDIKAQGFTLVHVKQVREEGMVRQYAVIEKDGRRQEVQLKGVLLSNNMRLKGVLDYRIHGAASSMPNDMNRLIEMQEHMRTNSEADALLWANRSLNESKAKGLYYDYNGALIPVTSLPQGVSLDDIEPATRQYIYKGLLSLQGWDIPASFHAVGRKVGILTGAQAGIEIEDGLSDDIYIVDGITGVQGLSYKVELPQATPQALPTDEDDLFGPIDGALFYTPENDNGVRTVLNARIGEVQAEYERKLGKAFANNVTFNNVGRIRPPHNRSTSRVDADGHTTVETAGDMLSYEEAWHEATHFVFEFLLTDSELDQVYRYATARMTKLGLPIRNRVDIAEFIAQQGERYASDRRNLRGVSKFLQYLFDTIAKWVRLLPMFRNDIADVLYDLHYTQRFVDAKQQRTQLRDFDVPFLSYTDNSANWMKVVNMLGGQHTIALTIAYELQAQAGTVMFRPGLKGLNADSIPKLIRMSADNARNNIVMKLLGSGQVYNYKRKNEDKTETTVYKEPVIEEVLENKEIDKNATYYVRGADGKIVIVKGDNIGSRPTVLKYYDVNADAYVPAMGKGKDSKPFMGSSIPIIEAFKSTMVESENRNSPLYGKTWREILNTELTAKLPATHYNTLRDMMLNIKGAMAGLWSKVLPGLDIDGIMDKGKNSIEDYMDGLRKIQDTVSKQDAEQTNTIDSQSALMRLMLSSIPMVQMRKGADGKQHMVVTQERASMDTMHLALKEAQYNINGIPDVAGLIATLKQAQADYEQDEDSIGSQVMISHVRSILYFLEAHQTQRRAYELLMSGRESEALKELRSPRYGYSSQLPTDDGEVIELLRKQGEWSSVLLRGLDSFYHSHYSFQPDRTDYDATRRSKVSNSSMSVDRSSGIKQNLASRLSRVWVAVNGKPKAKAVNENVSGKVTDNDGNISDRKTAVYVAWNEATESWDILHRTMDGNKEVSTRIASFTNVGSQYAIVMNSEAAHITSGDGNIAAASNLIRMMLKQIGLDERATITKYWVNNAKSIERENGVSDGRSYLFRMLIESLLGAKQYALTQVDSKQYNEANKREAAMLERALTSHYGATNNYGKEYVRRIGTMDSEVEEGDEADTDDMVYHPLGNYRMLNDLATIKMVVEGKHTKQTAKGVNGETMYLDQLAGPMVDTIGRGRKRLHALRLAPLKSKEDTMLAKIQNGVQPIGAISHQSRHRQSWVAADGMSMAGRTLNPLLMEKGDTAGVAGAQIISLHANIGIQIGEGYGVTPMGMTVADSYLQEEGNIRRNVESLLRGDSYATVALFNRSNRKSQPMVRIKARISDMKLGANESSNGIYYRQGDKISMDSDNLLDWLTMSYLRLRQAQMHSAHRLMDYFDRLMEEGVIVNPAMGENGALSNIVMNALDRRVNEWWRARPDKIAAYEQAELQGWSSRVRDIVEWAAQGLEFIGQYATVQDENGKKVIDQSLLLRYGQDSIRPSVDYLIIVGKDGNRTLAPGADLAGRGTMTMDDKDGKRPLRFQDELSVHDLNTRLWIKETTAVEGQAEPFDYNAMFELPMQTTEAGKAVAEGMSVRSLWDMLFYYNGKAYRETLVGMPVEQANANIRAMMDAAVQSFMQQHPQAMAQFIANPLSYADVRNAVYGRKGDKATVVFSALINAEGTGILQQLHKNNGGVAYVRREVDRTNERGQQRTHEVFIDKRNDTKRYITLEHLLIEQLNGNMNADVRSKDYLLRHLFRKSIAQLREEHESTGYYSLLEKARQKDYYDTIDLTSRGDLWVGAMIASQLIDDAVTELVGNSYTSYMKTVQKPSEKGMLNTVLDVSKRWVTHNANGFTPNIDDMHSVNRWSWTIMTDDMKVQHQWSSINGYNTEEVAATDGGVHFLDLEQRLLYNGMGAQMGVASGFGSFKSTAADVDVANDRVHNRKYNRNVMSGGIRAVSPNMAAWHAMMLNPHGMPLTEPQYWQGMAEEQWLSPPTSLYDAYVRFEAMAQQELLGLPTAIINERADEMLHKWYVKTRAQYQNPVHITNDKLMTLLADTYEQVITPEMMMAMTDVERASFIMGAVYPYLSNSNQRGAQKEETAVAIFPFESHTEPVQQGQRSRMSVRVGDSYVQANSYGELHDKMMSMRGPSVPGMSIEELMLSQPRMKMSDIAYRQDNTQEYYQLNANSVIDDARQAPMVQQLSILLSLPVDESSSAYPIIETLRTQWGQIQMDGLRKLTQKLTQRSTEGMSMDEMITMVTETVREGDMSKILKSLLREQQSRNDDSSMLSRILNDMKSGLDFAGARVKAFELLASWMRSEVIKQEMGAMRLIVATGDHIQVYDYYDKNGNHTVVDEDGLQWLLKHEPAQPTDIGSIEQMIQNNGKPVSMYAPRSMKAYGWEPVWDDRLEAIDNTGKLRQQIIALWNTMGKTDAQIEQDKAQAMRILEPLGLIRNQVTEAMMPNPMGAKYKLPVWAQPYHLEHMLVPDMQSGKLEMTNIRSLLNADNRVELMELLDSMVRGMMPQVELGADGKPQIGVSLDVEQVLAANPILAHYMGDIIRKVNDIIINGIDSYATRLRNAVIKDAQRQGKDYDKLVKDKKYMDDMTVKAMEAYLDAVVKKETGGTVQQWIDGIADAYIGATSIRHYVETRTPSGPGSSVTGLTVLWSPPSMGSMIWASSKRNAINGQDQDVDQLTVYYTPQTASVLGRGESTEDEERKRTFFANLYSLWDNYDAAMHLQEAINMDDLKSEASQAAEKALNGFLMPGSMVNSKRIRDSNAKGGAVGVFANAGKDITAMARAHQVSGSIWSQSITDANGTQSRLYWRTGQDYSIMQQVIEAMVNLATDNPKENALGVLGLTAETGMTAVALLMQPQLLHEWSVKHFDSIYADEVQYMNEAQKAEYRLKVLVNDTDSLATRKRKEVKLLCRLMRSTAGQAIIDTIEKGRSVGSASSTRKEYYAAAHALLSRVAANKGSVAARQQEYNDSEALNRKLLAEYIDKYVSITGTTDERMAIIKQAALSGERVYRNPKMFNRISSSAHDRLDEQISKTIELAGKGVTVEDIKRDIDEWLSTPNLQGNDAFIQAVLNRKEEMRDSLTNIYNLIDAINRTASRRKYDEQFLSDYYGETLGLLGRAALSGEWLRRGIDIAGLNQGIPNDPYKQSKLLTSIQSLTGYSLEEVFDIITAYRNSNTDKKDIAAFLDRHTGISREERMAKAAASIQQEYEHRSTQEGYDWVSTSVMAPQSDGTTMMLDYSTGIAQQGDMLAAILANDEMSVQVAALMTTMKGTEGMWLFHRPEVQAQFDTMLAMTAQDNISEAAFYKLYEEWDKALIAHWSESVGLGSPQQMLVEALHGMGQTASDGNVFIEMHGKKYNRVDVTTTQGRNIAVVELGSFLATYIETKRELVLNNKDAKKKNSEAWMDAPEVGLFLREVERMTIGGTDNITLPRMMEYDDAMLLRLQTGFANLPNHLRRLIELYQVLRFGFEYRIKAGMARVITTELHGKFTNHLRTSVIPLVNNGYMPTLLDRFWTQVLDKDIPGLKRFAKWNADTQEYDPPMGKNGYATDYTSNIRVGSKTIKAHAVMTGVSKIASVRTGSRGSSLQVGLFGTNPLSVSQLLLGDGRSVERAFREGRSGNTETTQGNEYYRSQQGAKGRWTPLAIVTDKQVWMTEEKERLYRLYRDALTLSVDPAVSNELERIGRMIARDEQLTFADDTATASIATLLTKWLQAARPAIMKIGQGITAAQVQEILANTDPLSKPEKGSVRYYVPRIGVAETTYSSLDVYARMEIDPEATAKFAQSIVDIIEQARATDSSIPSVDAGTVRHLLSSHEMVDMYVDGDYVGMVSRLNQLGNGAVVKHYRDMGITEDSSIAHHIMRSNASNWREVSLDTQQISDHLNDGQGSIVRIYGAPYHVGDVIHFGDGAVGIVTNAYDGIEPKKEGGRKLYRNVRYKVVEHRTFNHDGTEKGRAMVAALHMALPDVPVEWVDETDGNPGRVILRDGLPVIQMSTAQADSGVALHEYGHVWSVIWMSKEPQMWQQVVQALRDSPLWRWIEEQHTMNNTAAENEADLEYIRALEAVAYFISMSHYERAGILDLKYDDAVTAIVRETMSTLIGSFDGMADATLADVAMWMEKTMTDSSKRYLRQNDIDPMLWAVLPKQLNIQADASVKGLTMENIDRAFIYQPFTTTPTKQRLMDEALSALRVPSNKVWRTPMDRLIFLEEDGKRMTEAALRSKVSAMTKEVEALDMPAKGMSAWLRSLSKTEGSHLYSMAAKTWKDWSEDAKENTKEERIVKLRNWLDKLDYDPLADGVLDRNELAAMGLPKAVLTDDVMVVVKDKGTNMERYVVWMVTSSTLGERGKGNLKAKLIRQGRKDVPGIYLDNSLGSRLALKGAVIGMALSKVSGKRVEGVSVTNTRMKVQHRLMTDMVGQVQKVLVEDDDMLKQMEGGVYTLLNDKSLLNPDLYIGDVLHNLVAYAKTLHSRVEDKNSARAKWASTMVEAAEKTILGDDSAMATMERLVRRRLSFIENIVHRGNADAIAKDSEYAMLADWYRMLRTGERGTIRMTEMGIDENIRDMTRADDSIRIWVRDSIEQGLHLVRRDITPHIEWMEKTTRDLNAKRNKLGITGGASALFAPMFKTAQAVDENGKVVTVSLHALHIDVNDSMTRKALDSGDITTDMVMKGKEIHERMIAELAEYLYAIDKSLTGKGDERRANAMTKASAMLAGGMLPVMPRRAEAALAAGNVKDAVELMVGSLLNPEASSETFFDHEQGINTTKQMRSTLWEQFREGHPHGSAERLMLMGLTMEENGVLHLRDAKLQRNVSYNLQDIYNVSMNHSIRARHLRSAVTDANIALNIVRGLREKGHDTRKIEEMISVYADRMLFGRLPESYRIKVGGAMHQVDNILGVTQSAIYMANIAWAPLVAIKSAVSNSTKVMLSSVLNAMSGTNLFSPKSLAAAVQALTSDPALVEEINRALQVVGRSERDLVNHFKYNSTQKHALNKDTGMLGMWYGDYYSKLLGMTAQMIEEGTFQAYSLNDKGELVYDQTKDARFYNDGKLTADGELLLNDVMRVQKRSGIMAKDATVLPTAYDAKEMHRLRAIVERFAGEATDPTMKGHIQAYGLARAALTLRSYLLGTIQTWYRPSTDEDLLGGRKVVDGKVVWVGRPVEGILQTMGAMFKMAKEGRNPLAAKNLTQWQRRNQVLLLMHGAVIGLLIFLLEAMMDEEEDMGYGERSLKYVTADALREQFAAGWPVQTFNDITTKPSPILSYWGNSVSALWNSLMLPYRIGFEADKMTDGGKLSKLDKDTEDYVHDVLKKWSKVTPGGSFMRNTEMVVDDIFIGEGTGEE